MVAIMAVGIIVTGITDIATSIVRDQLTQNYRLLRAIFDCRFLACIQRIDFSVG